VAISERYQIQGKNPDLSTSIDASTKDNIGVIYGDSIKRELVSLDLPFNDDYGFSASGWVTGANYQGKKGNFLFFINSKSSVFRATW
jgi:DNA mismatch repair protein MLH1